MFLKRWIHCNPAVNSWPLHRLRPLQINFIGRFVVKLLEEGLVESVILLSNRLIPGNKKAAILWIFSKKIIATYA